MAIPSMKLDSKQSQELDDMVEHVAKRGPGKSYVTEEVALDYFADLDPYDRIDDLAGGHILAECGNCKEGEACKACDEKQGKFYKELNQEFLRRWKKAREKQGATAAKESDYERVKKKAREVILKVDLSKLKKTSGGDYKGTVKVGEWKKDAYGNDGSSSNIMDDLCERVAKALKCDYDMVDECDLKPGKVYELIWEKDDEKIDVTKVSAEVEASTASDYLRDLVNDSPSSEVVDLLSELLLAYLRENGKTDFLALIAPLAKDKAFAEIIKDVSQE